MLCFLFHCILSVWRYLNKQFLHINPLYLAVPFPFCMQMLLLVPPCTYICMYVHALFGSTIFSVCLCVHAPISSVISVRLSVCTCICQISYISLPAFQPVYGCMCQSDPTPVCTFVCPHLRTREPPTFISWNVLMNLLAVFQYMQFWLKWDCKNNHLTRYSARLEYSSRVID